MALSYSEKKEKREEKIQKILDKGVNTSFRVESGNKASRFMFQFQRKFGDNGVSVWKRGRYLIRHECTTGNEETGQIHLEYIHDERRLYVTFKKPNGFSARIQARIDKLFTKDIVKAFEKQGDCSQKGMEDINIICRLFNPYGGGTWYLYEKLDEDTYMCFANLGNPMFAEIGTVSISELASLTTFGAPAIERDRHFETKTLEEVYNAVKENKFV